jgi:hypothetical protein
LVAGDVFLSDVVPGGGHVLLDEIRFNPAGTGGNPAYPASLVFYSDGFVDGIDALADVPNGPTDAYLNFIILQETGIGNFNIGVIYTPLPGQPGFVAGFDVTYTFISDTPEPSSLLLLGSGALGLLGMIRRKLRA